MGKNWRIKSSTVSKTKKGVIRQDYVNSAKQFSLLSIIKRSRKKEVQKLR